MTASEILLAEIWAVRRQISYLEREMEDRGYYGKSGSRYKEFVEEAQLYGFYFPNTGKGRDNRLYYEAFDKERLPAHVVDYFNLLFCITKLCHRKRCLIWQRRRLAKERRREIQNNLLDALGLTKAQHWLRSKLLGGQEVPTTASAPTAPPQHDTHADGAMTAAAEVQVHANIRSKDRHTDLECPICMDADVEVQVQDCRHKMCTSCAVAVLKMPHPHCPFCRGRKYSFVPIPQKARW